jgi:hypothetical protein
VTLPAGGRGIDGDGWQYRETTLRRSRNPQ